MSWRPSSFSASADSLQQLPTKSEESALYRESLRDERWQDIVNTTKEKLFQLDIALLRSSAHRIAQGIQSMDATMSRYCELTCPLCEDPCCTGLEVFFNQADLLYLLALNEEIPPGQTRTHPNEQCRYLTIHGCSLRRTLRPYVCVWFLCEPQMELFQAESSGFQRRFIETMQDIRACRLRIESLYEKHFLQLKTIS